MKKEKHYTMNLDHCQGETLQDCSAFVLKEALMERLKDHHFPPNPLMSRKQIIEKEGVNFENKLEEIDRRLKRGFELIKKKLL